jgi:DNA gyrase subunit A
MIIRLPIEQIATSKRATQGVRLIKLNEGQNVATIAIVPQTDDDDEITDEMLEEINETVDTEGSTEPEVKTADEPNQDENNNPKE